MGNESFLVSCVQNPAFSNFFIFTFGFFIISSKISSFPKGLIYKGLSKKPALILDKIVRKSRLVHFYQSFMDLFCVPD